uniref:Ig-like domain-containing protein n=1 Tax=Amphiprion percula TaxID=161767 RepID=A0A3P8TIT8_AMPPE
MKNFTLIPALFLCSFGWIFLSVTECRMVEVQPGEDVTLLCSNFSSSPSQMIWFRLVNRTYPRCISSIFSSTQPASFCSGVEPDRFGLTSNSSTLFFKIKEVDLADSGFYFCGFYYKTHPVIVNSTYLKVPVKTPANLMIFLVEESDGTAYLTSFILAGLTVLLLMVIIGLINPDQHEVNPTSAFTIFALNEHLILTDDLNYTAVTFRTEINRRETEVIYSATR